eukprot:9492434-Pyramimonas_sp.AAC.1
MTRLMADSAHELELVEAGGRFLCKKCLSVAFTNSRGPKSTRAALLETPRTLFQPWTGAVQGARSVRHFLSGPRLFMRPTRWPRPGEVRFCFRIACRTRPVPAKTSGKSARRAVPLA